MSLADQNGRLSSTIVNETIYFCVFLLTVSMQDPPCKTVRKFLHLLEHSDADFEEELGICIDGLRF